MKEILKQSSWLIGAQILSRIIGFFYTIFLARNLGVSDYGLFSVGLAYFSIISSFSDFGFNRYLIKEASQKENTKWELLWNLMALRLTLICIFFGIFSVLLYLFDGNRLRVSVILLASLAVLPQTIAITFDGLFIALRKLQFSAIALITSSLGTVLLGFFMISKGFGVIGAVNALILGQFLFVLTFVYLLYRKLGFKSSQIGILVIKKALVGSLPYGLLGILGLLYFRIDTVLLSYLRGNFETGIYGAAYKFFEAITFIPAALSTALFPVLAKLHDVNQEQVIKLYFKSLKILFTISLLVVIGYFYLLPIIIQLLLPSYLPAVKAIVILTLAIPFMFCHYPAVQVLLSTDKYFKPVITISIILLSLNIVLNLIFIPIYGFIAASWITVFSEALSFLIYFRFLRVKVFKK
ncbi:hypothetical protein A3J13_00645 [Candidatus Daviesbacteria bacterium RIFCSPLOWO2_02_FULL_36_8]|uniref:Uncharacterized protein n=1 Tax=Candidatus Daviesbacteria bacterium RIFCSPLOWO2_02_FULL_36_8 TaxID=1797793 RepID=A0A1F5MFZ9_9BACT|nr:MAG: hypothetical protein A3J13_00645 [Candidatus Daviesbacteria bacterium RIFCSPLOWO2_02_FULL_36_8]